MTPITIEKARILFQDRTIHGYQFRFSQKGGWTLQLNFGRQIEPDIRYEVVHDDKGNRPMRFASKNDAQRVAVLIGFPDVALHPQDALDQLGQHSGAEQDQARADYEQLARAKHPGAPACTHSRAQLAAAWRAYLAYWQQTPRPAPNERRDANNFDPWDDEAVATRRERERIDAPYEADAQRAEQISTLLNMAHFEQSSDARFVGPPTPKHKGEDALAAWSAEERTPEAITRRAHRI